MRVKAGQMENDRLAEKGQGTQGMGKADQRVPSAQCWV